MRILFLLLLYFLFSAERLFIFTEKRKREADASDVLIPVNVRKIPAVPSIRDENRKKKGALKLPLIFVIVILQTNSDILRQGSNHITHKSGFTYN